MCIAIIQTTTTTTLHGNKMRQYGSLEQLRKCLHSHCDAATSMMETVSLPLLCFEEKCKIRLFDVLEADVELKVHCSWGSR